MELKNQLDWQIGGEQPDRLQLEAAEQKEYEINHHFERAFSTPSGKKVLEWLTLHTLDTPTWWPGKPTDYGFFREGQNGLVRQIKSKIEKAKNYQAGKK